MHLEHKPGEQMEVDWAGKTMQVTDSVTGEIYPAYIFVSVLSYSGYAYAEAFLNRTGESRITAHVNAYRHYGGVTGTLVPDNLKTGVTKRTKTDIYLNAAYQEMAEYYDTAVLPTRVRKPKDKASVEGTVGHVSTWIMAALLNWKFFSLAELNEAIEEKLHELNEKPFQKRQGSRFSVFTEEESPALLPLPNKPYELSEWKICTVAYNYHISADKMLYSVPHEYIKKQVDVRLTNRTVEIFLSGERIASHVRKYGNPGQYSTLPEHMPLSHREYMQWNAERFRSWARGIGKNTLIVVNAIFASRKIEQQGYRTCMALLKLSDKYSQARLEAACSRALTYTSSPNFKMVQTILATGQDELPQEEPRKSSSDFGFTRGSDYYGSGKNPISENDDVSKNGGDR
jgi:transposase